MEQYDAKNTLCSKDEMSENWNKTQSKTNNNIYTTYIKKEENHHRLQIIDMGSYCVINNITPDMLKLFVEYGVKLTELLVGKRKKTDSKIVVMSEEDFKAYEEYKKFKLFQKQHK